MESLRQAVNGVFVGYLASLDVWIGIRGAKAGIQPMSLSSDRDDYSKMRKIIVGIGSIRLGNSEASDFSRSRDTGPVVSVTETRRKISCESRPLRGYSNTRGISGLFYTGDTCPDSHSFGGIVGQC